MVTLFAVGVRLAVDEAEAEIPDNDERRLTALTALRGRSVSYSTSLEAALALDEIELMRDTAASTRETLLVVLVGE
jgi:hypothetical protein